LLPLRPSVGKLWLIRAGINHPTNSINQVEFVKVDKQAMEIITRSPTHKTQTSKN
jgi:hypothetical protein